MTDDDARLAEYESRIEMLTQELAATNAGVVALYAELEDQAHQLKEVSDLKSRFLSYMSHEFRTPLGSIRSIARILLDCMDGPLNEEQARQVGFIRSAAEELTEMVNDLLDLAKVEAGRVTISPEWFELVDLFAALRGMFRPLLQEKEIALVFEESHEVPRIYSDDKKLSQILRNFISNALKFTSHGEIRISARCLPDETLEFAVADTGVGISPEHLGTLFQDFVQVDTPMQRRYRGTGLGLSLSRRLAELLGGRVGVQSELGKGSVFSVVIPLRFRSVEEGTRP
ncbi:MAG TPA: ATP-binding protein [Candidatus Binatia bacterium]|nr:ATP-binding protein [Candidatus Binatia bacterium]